MGKSYVYQLCFPNGTPFYVGKGSKGRIHDHVRRVKRNLNNCHHNSIKNYIISSILNLGQEVREEIIFEDDSADICFDYEKRK